jgi:sugar/nucleoside kinase (ribokinase family)
VTISALGMVSWDQMLVVESWPSEGGFSMITRQEASPGGTTGNAAMTARRLGAEVALFAIAGSDPEGAAILDHLRLAGIDTAHVRTVESASDLSVVVVSQESRERTILWRQGPYLRRGDRIDIDRLFGADVVILDPVDIELRRFLTDLPAHTRPRARIVGALSYLVDSAPHDMLDIALRHDVIVGNAREYAALTGLLDPEASMAAVQSRLTGSNCRLAILTNGASGCLGVDRMNRWTCPALPVEAVDTTGAGDSFTGAIAFGLAQRWEVADTLRFASVVASFVVESLGAQHGLPSLDQALRRLAEWHVEPD